MLTEKEIAKISKHKRLRKILLEQKAILEAAGDPPGQRKPRFSLAELEAAIDASGGKCMICQSNGDGRKLTLDHCHNSGKLRGVLCSKCNTGLGMFSDRQDLLLSAIAYLKR